MFAVIWHWWIGFFLSFGSVGLVLALVVGYLQKVQNPKYPRKP
jgi:hypothetical protein